MQLKEQNVGPVEYGPCWKTNKKPSCRYNSRPYLLSVTLVIQGPWFSSHLDGRICYFLLVINNNNNY